MIVGLGGNNGSTVVASCLANRRKLEWRTREGSQKADYLGSMLMSSTVKLGQDSLSQKEVHVPMHTLLPMIHPNNLVIGGWDICGDDLATAMFKSKVLEPDLQRQVVDDMRKMKPLPSIYSADFIAANQVDRATNLIPGTAQEQLDVLRKQMRQFKAENKLDKLIVLWSATTERFSQVLPGVNDTGAALLSSIKNNHSEIAPSVIFAVACILEKVPFINGSPQNTLLSGVIDLSEREGSYIAGDDFKSGQTKIKSVLADFLVGAGIKPLAITSYNHLGNNDGRNLSAPPQFRSKEISKTNVVDDVVSTNTILYPNGEHPDHTVVIKYVPSVGDSKRAMDEYYSQIFMGGKNTLAIHNTCEDSLLAAPIILDLAIAAELLTRVRYRIVSSTNGEKPVYDHPDADGFTMMHPVMGALGYFLKAPVFQPGVPVIHALFKQRALFENLMRACAGLSSTDVPFSAIL